MGKRVLSIKLQRPLKGHCPLSPSFLNIQHGRKPDIVWGALVMRTSASHPGGIFVLPSSGFAHIRLLLDSLDCGRSKDYKYSYVTNNLLFKPKYLGFSAPVTVVDIHN